MSFAVVPVSAPLPFWLFLGFEASLEHPSNANAVRAIPKNFTFIKLAMSWRGFFASIA